STASKPAGSSFHAGISTRKVVPFPAGSHSTMPPCPPPLFATSARPRPAPFCFAALQGPDRTGTRAPETPGPWSWAPDSTGRDQRKAEAGPVLLRRDEGVEQDRQYVFRNAGAVVVDAEFQRQRHAVLRARNRNPDARPERGGQRDLAARVASHRLGRVLHEVE